MIRLCLHLSSEIGAKGPHSQYLPNVSMIHLGSVAVLFLLELIRRRRGNQVHLITSPRSIPSATIGNAFHTSISVLPDVSSDVGASVACSQKLAVSSHDAWRAGEDPRDHEVAIYGEGL